MSGKFDIITVTLVPGGPDVGYTVRSGLASEPRSVVADTEFTMGRSRSPNKMTINFLNFARISL